MVTILCRICSRSTNSVLTVALCIAQYIYTCCIFYSHIYINADNTLAVSWINLRVGTHLLRLRDAWFPVLLRSRLFYSLSVLFFEDVHESPVFFRVRVLWLSSDTCSINLEVAKPVESVDLMKPPGALGDVPDLRAPVITENGVNPFRALKALRILISSNFVPIMGFQL